MPGHGSENGATTSSPETSWLGSDSSAVLTALHLLFNEGYWSTDDEAPIRGDLCRLAIGLARSLREALPEQPEGGRPARPLPAPRGRRRPARLDGQGAPVPLPDQDRLRWDRTLIDEGTAELERALAVGRPGPFQTEAAISAVHCRARAAADTDWRRSRRCTRCSSIDPLQRSASIELSLSRVEGPTAGLALLDAGTVETREYPYVHLVRGTLLEELGRAEQARASLAIAMANARNAHEAAQIKARIERIEIESSQSEGRSS